jgi:hypothetical protein
MTRRKIVTILRCNICIQLWVVCCTLNVLPFYGEGELGTIRIIHFLSGKGVCKKGKLCLILRLLFRCVQLSVRKSNDGRNVLTEGGDILEARLKCLRTIYKISAYGDTLAVLYLDEMTVKHIHTLHCIWRSSTINKELNFLIENIMGHTVSYIPQNQHVQRS